jgi:hypothetical protein
MVPIGFAIWLAILTAGVAALLSAVSMHYWCTHRRRPRVNFSTTVAVLDARTTAVLRALDGLPLGEAHAVLWSILRLIDATAQVSVLWPDAAELTAGAAVARAAERAPTRGTRPRLVPPTS